MKFETALWIFVSTFTSILFVQFILLIIGEFVGHKPKNGYGGIMVVLMLAVIGLTVFCGHLADRIKRLESRPTPPIADSTEKAHPDAL